MSAKKSFLLSSLKMSIATLSSRVLGFLREIIFANIFGASGFTDAYYVAFRIPNMLRDLFAEGAFSSAFVPIFTGEKNKGDKNAIRLMWSMALVLLFITGIISVLIYFNADHLVAALTDKKFVADPERFEIATNLTRMMSPFLAFVSLAALFLGVLNTYKMFFAPALAPAAFNIIMIASMLTFPIVLEERGIHKVYSLGIGVFFGGLVQMLFQLPLLWKKGLLRFEGLSLGSKKVKQVLGRMSIGTVGVAATQINLFVSTILATGTTLGAVSWLSYSFRLFQFPVGILGVSIGNANLVHFSDHWKRGEKGEAIICLSTSYLTSLFVLLPAAFLIFLLSKESVMLAFERGAFSGHDTEMVTMALKAYLLGLPFYGLYKVFSPSFYTIDKPKIPVMVSSASVLLNIIFCVSLIDSYGFRILAFGTSLSMIFIIVTLGFLMGRYLEVGLSFFFNLKVLKFLSASILMFLVGQYFKEFLYASEVGTLLLFTLMTILSAFVYLSLLCAMGEYRHVAKFLRRFFKRN